MVSHKSLRSFFFVLPHISLSGMRPSAFDPLDFAFFVRIWPIVPLVSECLIYVWEFLLLSIFSKFDIFVGLTNQIDEGISYQALSFISAMVEKWFASFQTSFMIFLKNFNKLRWLRVELYHSLKHPLNRDFLTLSSSDVIQLHFHWIFTNVCNRRSVFSYELVVRDLLLRGSQEHTMFRETCNEEHKQVYTSHQFNCPKPSQTCEKPQKGTDKTVFWAANLQCCNNFYFRAIGKRMIDLPNLQNDWAKWWKYLVS